LLQRIDGVGMDEGGGIDAHASGLDLLSLGKVLRAEAVIARELSHTAAVATDLHHEKPSTAPVPSSSSPPSKTAKKGKKKKRVPSEEKVKRTRIKRLMADVEALKAKNAEVEGQVLLQQSRAHLAETRLHDMEERRAEAWRTRREALAMKLAVDVRQACNYCVLAITHLTDDVVGQFGQCRAKHLSGTNQRPATQTLLHWT
jgi:hypothetical protein